MKNLLLIIIVLVLNDKIANAQYQKIEILYDSFVDNKTNWATGNNENRNLNISNGKYYFEHKRNKRSWVTSKVIEFDEYKDFEIEASITKLSSM